MLTALKISNNDKAQAQLGISKVRLTKESLMKLNEDFEQLKIQSKPKSNSKKKSNKTQQNKIELKEQQKEVGIEINQAVSAQEPKKRSLPKALQVQSGLDKAPQEIIVTQKNQWETILQVTIPEERVKESVRKANKKSQKEDDNTIKPSKNSKKQPAKIDELLSQLEQIDLQEQLLPIPKKRPIKTKVEQPPPKKEEFAPTRLRNGKILLSLNEEEDKFREEDFVVIDDDEVKQIVIKDQEDIDQEQAFNHLLKNAVSDGKVQEAKTPLEDKKKADAEAADIEKLLKILNARIEVEQSPPQQISQQKDSKHKKIPPQSQVEEQKFFEIAVDLNYYPGTVAKDVHKFVLQWKQDAAGGSSYSMMLGELELRKFNHHKYHYIMQSNKRYFQITEEEEASADDNANALEENPLQKRLKQYMTFEEFKNSKALAPIFNLQNQRHVDYIQRNIIVCKPQPTDGEGYVYVYYRLKDEELLKKGYLSHILLYKVGRTCNLPSRRVNAQQQKNGEVYKVKETYATKFNIYLEYMVHQYFQNCRVVRPELADGKTEWFLVNFAELQDIILKIKAFMIKQFNDYGQEHMQKLK